MRKMQESSPWRYCRAQETGENAARCLRFTLLSSAAVIDAAWRAHAFEADESLLTRERLMMSARAQSAKSANATPCAIAPGPTPSTETVFCLS